jgi:hypothetical protein
LNFAAWVYLGMEVVGERITWKCISFCKSANARHSHRISNKWSDLVVRLSHRALCTEPLQIYSSVTLVPVPLCPVQQTNSPSLSSLPGPDLSTTTMATLPKPAKPSSPARGSSRSLLGSFAASFLRCRTLLGPRPAARCTRAHLNLGFSIQFVHHGVSLTLQKFLALQSLYVV